MYTIKKVFAQTSWQVLGKGISVISSFIILGVLARQYGSTNTGIYTLSLTYLSFFYLAADLGLNNYLLPKFIGGETSNILNQLFTFRLYLSFILILITMVITPFFSFSNERFYLSVMYGSLTITFSALFTTINLVFQKKLRYDLSVLSSIIGSLAVIPLVLLLATLHVSVSMVILAGVGGWIVNFLAAFILVSPLHKFRIERVDLSFITDKLKGSWPIALALLLNVLYFRVDSFILQIYKSYDAVGVYGMAYPIFQNALVLPTFIMNGYYPLMIETFKSNTLQFVKQLRVAIFILLALSLLGIVVTYILAPSLILLLSGSSFSQFSGSIAALRILSLGFPAHFLTPVMMWVLLLTDDTIYLPVISFIGSTVNIILNLVFIPHYSYIAAAWTTGISEYLILILQLIILYPKLRKLVTL